jgi:hypothetical protein
MNHFNIIVNEFFVILNRCPEIEQVYSVVGLIVQEIRPSVFGCNLQCEPVRKWTPERTDVSHTHGRASSGANA